MARIFKVLAKREDWGQPAKPPQPIKAEISTEAMFLVEDIRSLEMAGDLLKKVDPANVTQDREFGYAILQAVTAQVELCRRYAKLKLRREFLAP